MRTIILLLCLALLLPVAAQSYTITVSGNVSGVWYADTVKVVGEIVVPSWQSLTINPGVEVLFMGNYKLIVQSSATLHAVGTEWDPIRFDSYYYGQYWHGIRLLYASNNSRLENCTIKHAYASGYDTNGGGVQIDHCSPTIVGCQFDDCKALTDGGAIWASYSNSEIAFCSFTNCFGDDDCGAIYFAYGSPTIHANYIANNHADDWCGAVWLVNCNVTFTNNTLTGNWSGDDGGGITLTNTSGIINKNTITNNSTNDWGGGICCENSTVTIEDNLIIGNHAADDGGGIVLRSNSVATVRRNTIASNTTSQTGGGISCLSPNNIIEDNDIFNNTSSSHGAGVYSVYTGNTFRRNFIAYNTTGSSATGGGLYLSASSQTLEDNIISHNAAQNGGGVYIYSSSTVNLLRNNVAHNTAWSNAGGIYYSGSSGLFNKNTVRNNSGVSTGGVYFASSTINIENSIIRGNSWGQIGGYPGSVTYSNIEGGWYGVGNMDADPMFATTAQPHGDLLWGSPCIDAGDPYDPYDPDNTRIDMGANFYDQSKPVRILATPYDAPLLIQTYGGSFNFLITVSNCTWSPLYATIWCDITIPDGSIYGPVIGPVTVTTSPNLNVNRIRTQWIPSDFPNGRYTFNAFVTSGWETSSDSFTFTKQGSTLDAVSGGALNTGEAFEEISMDFVDTQTPDNYAVLGAYPNPFNPTTELSYELRVAGSVLLNVYDIQGREVARLVEGFKEPGQHYARFDGTGLASGVYLYRLSSSDGVITRKMILQK
ncbi:T9SS type A sorting domain-containing protein [bacterium]|nr:T9SS type A sorting domain-containing protein [bacterium]